ncbi:hypothetical protein [Actinokineospora pegani]|uniref:hypothetical protein n=1 Tax=Actinokineospora pegani TaxID=2654637 RepID=UPI0012EABADC|nr:hypothetical protein [Actinokineospora pegani]
MTAPARRTVVFNAALALFGIGLVAVVAIFVMSMAGVHAPWLWAVSMAFPIGLMLAVWDTVRNRRS